MQTPKNPHLKLLATADAHSRSESPQILLNPYNPTQLITIGHNLHIQIHNKDTLQPIRSIRVMSPYLMALVPWEGEGKGGFLLGIGDGRVLVLDREWRVDREVKGHQDCVSAIVVGGGKVITGGYDGDVIIRDGQTLQLQKRFHFGLPITQLVLHNNTLYIASTPSHSLSLSTLQTHPLPSYTQFLTHKALLFASSPQGITCLSHPSPNSTIPLPRQCQYMLSLGDVIVFCAGEEIGVLWYGPDQGEDGWRWRMERVEGIKGKGGCRVLGAVVEGGFVWMTGESGDVWKFRVVQEGEGDGQEKIEGKIKEKVEENTKEKVQEKVEENNEQKPTQMIVSQS